MSEKPTQHGLVVIQRGKRDLETGRLLPPAVRKEVLPIPDELNGFYSSVEDQINYINRQNISHGWKACLPDPLTGKLQYQSIDVTLQQKHSGGPQRYTRLYTRRLGGQSLKKSERRTLVVGILEEPVIELDFQASQLRIAYHLAHHLWGADPPNPRKDLYRPAKALPKLPHVPDAEVKQLKKLRRKLVKQATVIAMNSSNPMQAAKALETSIHKHSDCDLLRMLLDRNGTNAVQLIKRLPRLHPGAGSIWHQREIATRLMTLECTVMLNVCRRFANAGPIIYQRELTEQEQIDVFGKPMPGASDVRTVGKPVLPIHDAVVCRASDEEFARETMTKAYRQVMDFEPVIKRSF